VSSTSTTSKSASTAKALDAATERLSDRVQVSERRLGNRLQSLYAAHSLQAGDLWESQRKIARMNSEGSAPSPSEFWAETAEPWAAMLTTTSISAIDEEMIPLSDAVGRFTESVAIANANGGEISNQTIRTRLQTALTDPIAAVRHDSTHLDGLGVVWHSRLRRAAWRRTFPAALFRSSSVSDLKIATAQVELASAAPWAHGDRLLSAFEGAQADIREHLSDALAAATTVHATGLALGV
jgi:hypothetical protein